MVRIEYPGDEFISMEIALADYRKITRQAYKLLKGTWGYCSLEYEQIKLKKVESTPTLSSLFDPDTKIVMRGYVCFADELDALQFRLSISTSSQQVKMWPERWFTIHEMVDIDES